MQKKVYNIEIIGLGLAFLYALSCLAFINYLNIPELKGKMIIYIVLFGSLAIGSIGVMTLKEWRRQQKRQPPKIERAA